MAKKEEKTPLKKGKASFMLIGEVKINDYTFGIDKESQKSDWVYNQMNLGVDCGNGNTIYVDLMGGYGAERENVVYAHGIKEVDGKKTEDFENRITIDWDDRFDNDILETVGESCFIKVGIEKDAKDKTFSKKFLSAYDAIAYIQEHLENGTVVNVKGNLKYQFYNDYVTVKKELTSIYLSKGKPEDYKALFTQTLLVDNDAVGKVDKEKASYPITAYVVDYVGKHDGQEVKQNVAFAKLFELEVDKSNPANTKKLIQKIFTPAKKEQLVEVTVEGELVEGASIVNITTDDIPEDIKELIELNILSEEEALNKCAIGGSKEKRMIIKRPFITFVGEGEEKRPVLAIDKDKYTENDLVYLSQLIDEDDEESKEEKPMNTKTKKTTTSKSKKEEIQEDEEDEDENAWMKLLDDDE
ncbi:MAG: hypothetical protein PHX62_08785 [Bacilli bacterium]|nr:hypothetical protein [Bacilli bacterium]